MLRKSGKRKVLLKTHRSFFRRLHFVYIFLKSNIFWFITFVFFVFYVGHIWITKISKTNIPYFSIKKIEFDGNERVQEILLLKASGLRYKTNILSCDLYDIKKKLENISWIKSVIVQRRFPDTIYIRVAERIPIAILQSKYKLYLVDSDGVVLDHDGIGNYNNLPIVVGEEAEKEAGNLLQCLKEFPKIRNQLVFAVRIGKRRWNIKINKGITVKLPERGLIHAFMILEEVSDSKGFFKDDIESIDLRILDRIIITRKKINS